MPIRQRVDRERRRIVATVWGEVTLADIIGAIDASVQDPAFEPGFDVLSDHREIERVITVDQLMEMSEHLRELSESMAGARWAVVTSQPASYGMMRMLSVYAQNVPMEVRVFLDPQEAEAWLAGPGVDGSERGA